MDTPLRNCVQILFQLSLWNILRLPRSAVMLHSSSSISSVSLVTCRVVIRWLRRQPTETRRLCTLKSPERYNVPLLQRSSACSSWASLAFKRSSWEAKRKASRVRCGETWITYSIFMHLPPPLKHSPTLQNSNNTKQYNTQTYHNQHNQHGIAKPSIPPRSWLL